jgi:uncharacterized membrane protein
MLRIAQTLSRALRKGGKPVDWYQIILRVVHILAGVFWVGTAIFFFLYLQPAVKEIGPTGQQFMDHLVEKKKIPMVITASAAVTILAGILLYWRDSNGFDLDWITSATGLAFTVGGAAAILAFVFGLVLVKPAVERMGSIGQAIAMSGGPPTDAQTSEMQRLGARLTLIGQINLLLLIVAVVAMAVARFL